MPSTALQRHSARVAWSADQRGDLPRDTSLRDRIAALARRHGRTNIDELAGLVARAEQEEFWARRNEDIVRLSDEARHELAIHERIARQYTLTEQAHHAAG